MARRDMKLKITGQGQNTAGLTSKVFNSKDSNILEFDQLLEYSSTLRSPACQWLPIGFVSACRLLTQAIGLGVVRVVRRRSDRFINDLVFSTMSDTLQH